MNAEVTPQEGCRRSLHVDLPPEDVVATRKRILKAFQGRAEIPGYRRGKVPFPVLERRFGEALARDLLEELTRTAWRSALKEKEIKVVSLVDIHDNAVTPEGGFSAEYVFDAPPEFDLPDYSSIPVRYEKVAIDDGDVDRQLESLRASAGTYRDASADHVVAKDDLVSGSLTGSADGGSIAEWVGEEHKSLAATDDAWAHAGSDYGPVPGFGNAVLGHKAGDEVSFDTVFPDDFYVETLRGKAVHYAGTVTRVQEFVPAELDETFCQRFGAANPDELRVAIRARLEDQAANANRGRLTEALCQYLLSNTSFEPPQSSVDAETRGIVQEMVSGGMRRGADKDDILKDKEKILENAQNLARDRIRVSFILRRIAEAEKIEATQGEVRARIRDIAAQRDSTYEKTVAELARANALQDIQDAIVRDKTVEWLRERAKEA